MFCTLCNRIVLVYPFGAVGWVLLLVLIVTTTQSQQSCNSCECSNCNVLSRFDWRSSHHIYMMAGDERGFRSARVVPRQRRRNVRLLFGQSTKAIYRGAAAKCVTYLLILLSHHVCRDTRVDIEWIVLQYQCALVW